MTLIKLLTIATLASIIPGQLLRFPLSSVSAFNLTDIFAFITVTLFYANSFLKKSLILPKYAIAAWLFSLSAISSTVLAANFFTLPEITNAFLFLVRFIIYFSFAIVSANTISKSQIENWIDYLIIIGLVFSFLGFVQLLVYPNLSSLEIYGWDPHVSRLVSSFLDPNFTGGILIIFFALATTRFLFSKQHKYLLCAIIFATAGTLTFSRSTYLGMATATVVIGALRSPRLLLAGAVFSVVIFLFIGQVRQRVIGALSVDETAQARIESWQKAIITYSKNPLFGVGFNTYRYYQRDIGYFDVSNPEGGHSGAGSDSSILLVAATTGTVGLVFYLSLIAASIAGTLKNSKTSGLKLATTASFCGLLIHSQFVNSLFFPQITIVLWFLLGLSSRQE